LLTVPVHRVVLAPLPGEVERELARSLIGEAASQEVLDTILTSVDGNPLFLEERLQSLLETRTLVREDGVWQLGQTTGPGVPQVLERLVRSRVDRLSPAAREVIRPASVLGLEFPLSLLTAVCAAAEPLGPAVAELCARDLWQEVARQPDVTFRFRHALIQEAIYEGLLRAERRRLHGRAAWALEAVSAGRVDEVAAVLGHHFAAAGEAERAVTYLELAGEHATAAFANDEAVSVFRAALAVIEDPHADRGAVAQAEARLQAKLANVLWRTARRDQARDAFRQALRTVDEADVLLRAHLETRLGRLEMGDHHFAAAAAAFDVAQALLGTDPAGKDDAAVDQWLEMMLDGRASLHAVRNEPDLALATLQAARPVLQARGSPARTSSFYHVLALAHVIKNGYRVDESDLANVRASAAAAAQGDDEKDLGYADFFAGWLLWLHGDLTEAQEQLETSLALAERIGESVLLGASLLGLTLVAMRRHDVAAVRSLTPRAMAAASAMGSTQCEADVTACLVWLAWQDGRQDDVVSLSAQVSAHEPTGTVVGSCASYQWVHLWPLIAAHLTAGHVGEAVAAARRLRQPRQQRLPADLDTPVQAAAAAWEHDQRDQARDKLAAALALARDLRYC
jgi:predicted ATPase